MGFSSDDNSIFSFSSVSNIVLSGMAEVVAAAATIVLVMMMVEMKEEEDKKDKMKKAPFSKQVGFILERGNKFF